MMTLNQIVKRIETIAANHRQLRNFYFGSVTDFLTDKQTKYASMFLQDQPGALDIDGKTISYTFKAFFLDLENIANDTQANTIDVQSDMMQIAADMFAKINYSDFTDWKVLGQANFVLVREEFDDIISGCAIDITIATPYEKDVCAVPTYN